MFIILSSSALFPRLFAFVSSDVAGFLALSEKSAFPSFAAQWLSVGLSIMEMTVAGTAQDSHLIPFSCTDEPPAHHHIGYKGTQLILIAKLFLKNLCGAHNFS
jgi:hypothetical protein